MPSKFPTQPPAAEPLLPRRSEDEPPPFLRAWPRVYTAVLCYLAVLILSLYAVTKFFSY
jgi:hypothetical protein